MEELQVDSIDVNGGEVGNPAYFFQTIQDNATETVIVTQGVYNAITAVRTEVDLQAFTAIAGSALRYDGLKPRKFLISASVSWEAGATLNHIYKIAIMKNGVMVGECRAALDNANVWPRNVSLSAIVELDNLDTVEIYVTDDDGTQNILIIDQLFTGASI